MKLKSRAWKWTAVALALVLLVLPLVLPPVVEALVSDRLEKVGVEARVSMTMGYCWRNGPGVNGELSVSVPGTRWKVESEYAASLCEWALRVRVPKTEFDERDPLVARLLRQYPLPQNISNLVFSSSIAVEARAERTFSRPVPVWKVQVPVKELSVSAMVDNRAMEVEGLSVTLGASGIADHYDIDPMFVRARMSTVIGLSVTNLSATIRATERTLMVSELSAKFCGGRLSAYSVFLDPKRLNAGFTLFLDEIGAGEVMRQLNGFSGEVTGRMHGRMRAFVREGGRSVRLGDVSLYSTPGQTGKLRVQDAGALEESLVASGLDKTMRHNVAMAMTDLDYSVLRFDLKRGEKESARLSIQLRGTARNGGLAVPVDIAVNLNGDIEQLINTGLGYRYKGKGKNP